MKRRSPGTEIKLLFRGSLLSGKKRD